MNKFVLCVLLTYVKASYSRFIEGDILIHKDTDLDSSLDIAGGVKLADPSKIWPGGFVYYRFDRTFSNTQHQNHIESMMRYIELKVDGCITFEKSDTKVDFVSITADGGNKGSGTSCFSDLGRIGGKQILNLDISCLNNHTIVHELMHTLGFSHEHNRPDRDSYVTVFTDNILESKKGNFKKRESGNSKWFEPGDVDMLNTPFDFMGVLLYPPSKSNSKSVSKNGKITLEYKAPIIPSWPDILENEDPLSVIDRVELGLAYTCKLDQETLIQYVHYNRLSSSQKISNLETKLVKLKESSSKKITSLETNWEQKFEESNNNQISNLEEKLDQLEKTRKLETTVVQCLEESNRKKISNLEEKLDQLKEAIQPVPQHTENGNPSNDDTARLFKNMKDELEERFEELEELTKVATLRSCSEYSDFGLRKTGFYMIDPDGPLIGQAPFQVLCNFTTGSTEVLHDSSTLTTIEHCHNAGCYEKDVSYINGKTSEPIPLSQIEALIQLSDYCEQGFSYECTSAPLHVADVDFAFWTDRHNETNFYFTGANKGFHSCDCHFSDEGCTEQERRGNRCNCDANLPTPLKDSGTITNTTALPVTKLSFGGLDYEMQTGAYQLGNLKCFGKTTTVIGSSCSSLKLKGTTQSGYYDIKKPGDEYTSLVFCDMSADGYLVTDADTPDRSSPLGTIVSWVSKPNFDSAQDQKIPDGWVLCNASLIEKGPWAGGRTPNLNSGHFLRGGELDKQLEKEEDQIQDHEHTDPGHTHTASSSSSPHTHKYETHLAYDQSRGSKSYCYHHASCLRDDYPSLTWKEQTKNANVLISTTVSSHTTGISGVTSSFRKGEETRPKNMKISWIMKCW